MSQLLVAQQITKKHIQVPAAPVKHYNSVGKGGKFCLCWEKKIYQALCWYRV